MAQFDPQGRVYWGKRPSDFPAAIWYDTSAYPNVLMKFNIGDNRYLEIASFEATNPNGTLAVNGASVGSVALSLNDLRDVLAATPNSGDVISYDGSNWAAVAPVAAAALADLSNVDTNAALGGQVLTFNGTTWTAQAGGSSSLDGLSDVTTNAALGGQVLTYDGTNWTAQAGSSASLDGLSDVSTASAVAYDLLRYDGVQWARATSAQVMATGQLGDIGNVSVPTPSIGDVLKYDGTNWVPAAETGGGGSAGTLGTWKELGEGGVANWLAGAAYQTASYGTVRYRKDDRGLVELTGIVTGLTHMQAICLLPAGYRPAHNLFISTVAASGSSVIYINNNVSIYNSSLQTSHWTSLFNIRFEALS